MLQRRLFLLLLLFMLLQLILVGRLAYIQLIGTHHFSKHNIDLVAQSIKQRTETFILHSGRGYFVDRNGIGLTMDYYPSLVIFPFISQLEWPASKVAEILAINKEDVIRQVEQAEKPFVLESNGEMLKLTDEQMKRMNALKIPGIYAHFIEKRTENTAPHLIGVTGENIELLKERYATQYENGSVSPNAEIGVSGLQRAFDPFLLSSGEAKLAYFIDNNGSPLFGFDVRYSAPASPYHPTKVMTTINKDLQVQLSETLKKVGLKHGGAVLLDVQTSELLALVSQPTFNVDQPFGYGAKNEMITAHTPGSIFKIVVAAAAIETGIFHKLEPFNCNRNVYDNGPEPRQLGTLTLQDSFAQSCNYTFAKIANELLKKDKEILNRYAAMLGLTEPVGWSGDIYRLEDVKHFPEEEISDLVLSEEDYGNYGKIAQTAIGQHNVRLTPLAVANMLATIARGGEKLQVLAAKKIMYENETTLAEFSKQKLTNTEKISRYTIIRLQQMLREVVKNEKGTGYAFLHDRPYQIAGKSGTAQKGEKNKDMNHWFAGYFPANNPHYVLVVVDLDHHEGEKKTIRAFSEFVDYLYTYDQTNPD